MTNALNPYSGADIWSFFTLFFSRLFDSSSQMASDELQIFVLIGIALSSCLVGSFLMLRKMAMLANALSHTILIGIVLAFLILRVFLAPDSKSFEINLEAMLIASLITGLITTFLTDTLSHVFKLQEDASIGLVFTTLFALGIILVTLFTKNTHIGTEVVMGNVDALQSQDLKLVYIIALINVVVFTLFFKEFKLTTFDSLLAKSLGFSPVLFSYLLMVQVSLTAIGAFRAVGVLMVLSYLIGPSLIARLYCNRLKTMIFTAIVIGISVSIVGVALSRHIFSVTGIALSTGSVVVTIISLVYLVCLLIKVFFKPKARYPLITP